MLLTTKDNKCFIFGKKKQRQERTWLNLEKSNNMIRLKTGYGENITGMRNVQNLDCLTKKTEHNLFYSETEQDLTHVLGG